MNYFTQELQNLVAKDPALKTAKCSYIGRACFIELSGGRRMKIEFATLNISEHYETLRMTVLTKTEGKIDTQRLLFKDYCAARPGSCAGTYTPHIWVYDGKAGWYGSPPSEAEQKELAAAIAGYVSLFA